MLFGGILSIGLMLFGVYKTQSIFGSLIFIGGIGLFIFTRKELDYYYQIQLFETVEENYDRRITESGKAR